MPPEPIEPVDPPALDVDASEPPLPLVVTGSLPQPTKAVGENAKITKLKAQAE
ncbi:MAG TPA: hypothetical protein PK156_38280 [Polyangium sp.]|nr:hypothetical protein [Polyangium sp.]